MMKRWPVWLGLVAPGALVAALALPGCRERRLLRDVKDERAPVRAAALRALPVRGNEHVFIAALADEEADVRFIAAKRLGGKGGRAVERADALAAALVDERLYVRRAAAESLGRVGPEAWPAIRAGLTSADARRRAGAAQALRAAYPPKEDHSWPGEMAQDILPVLDALAADKDSEVRRAVQTARARILGDEGR
jgi:HEAT repeat protein